MLAVNDHYHYNFVVAQPLVLIIALNHPVKLQMLSREGKQNLKLKIKELKRTN